MKPVSSISNPTNNNNGEGPLSSEERKKKLDEQRRAGLARAGQAFLSNLPAQSSQPQQSQPQQEVQLSGSALLIQRRLSPSRSSPRNKKSPSPETKPLVQPALPQELPVLSPEQLQDEIKMGRIKLFSCIAHANRPDIQPLLTPGRDTFIPKESLQAIIGSNKRFKMVAFDKIKSVRAKDQDVTFDEFKHWYLGDEQRGMLVPNLGCIEVEAILAVDMNFRLNHLHGIILPLDQKLPISKNNSRCIVIRTHCDQVLVPTPSEVKSTNVDLSVTPNTYRALPGKISRHDMMTVRPDVTPDNLLLNCGDQGFVPRRAEINWLDIVRNGKLQISDLIPPGSDDRNPYHFIEVLYSLLQNCLRPVEFIEGHIKNELKLEAVRLDAGGTYLASIKKHFDPDLFAPDILSRLPEFITYFRAQCQFLESKRKNCDLHVIKTLLKKEGQKLEFKKEEITSMMNNRMERMKRKLKICFCPRYKKGSIAIGRGLSYLETTTQVISAQIAADNECKDSALFQAIAKIYLEQMDNRLDIITVCGLNSFAQHLPARSQNIASKIEAKVDKQKKLEEIAETSKSTMDGMLFNALQVLLTPLSFHYTRAKAVYDLMIVTQPSLKPEIVEKIHEAFFKEMINLEEIICNVPIIQQYLIEQMKQYVQGHTGPILQLANVLLEQGTKFSISREQCIQELDTRVETLQYFISNLPKPELHPQPNPNPNPNPNPAQTQAPQGERPKFSL